MAGEHLDVLGAAQHRAGAGVLDQVAHPVGGQFGVQRDVGQPGLEHPEDRHHQVERALQVDADEAGVLGGPQPTAHQARPPVEFGVAEHRALELDGGRGRGRPDLLLEGGHHGRVRVGRARPVPVGEDPRALLRRTEPGVPGRPVGVGDQRFQQPGGVVQDAGDGRLVQQCRVVRGFQDDVRAGAVGAQPDRERGLGFGDLGFGDLGTPTGQLTVHLLPDPAQPGVLREADPHLRPAEVQPDVLLARVMVQQHREHGRETGLRAAGRLLGEAQESRQDRCRDRMRTRTAPVDRPIGEPPIARQPHHAHARRRDEAAGDVCAGHSRLPKVSMHRTGSGSRDTADAEV